MYFYCITLKMQQLKNTVIIEHCKSSSITLNMSFTKNKNKIIFHIIYSIMFNCPNLHYFNLCTNLRFLNISNSLVLLYLVNWYPLHLVALFFSHNSQSLTQLHKFNFIIILKIAFLLDTSILQFYSYDNIIILIYSLHTVHSDNVNVNTL